jgi:hypothetical protein
VGTLLVRGVTLREIGYCHFEGLSANRQKKRAAGSAENVRRADDYQCAGGFYAILLLRITAHYLHKTLLQK